MSERVEQALIIPCPQCGTRFRVAPEALTVADGQVRCGVCFTVFDGRASREVAAPPATPSAAPEPAVAPAVPPGAPAPPVDPHGLPPEVAAAAASAAPPVAPPTPAPTRETPMLDDAAQAQDHPAFQPQAPGDDAPVQDHPAFQPQAPGDDAPAPSDDQRSAGAGTADVAPPEPAPPARLGARAGLAAGRGPRRPKQRREKREEARPAASLLVALALAAALLPINLLALGFEPWSRQPALRPVYEAGCALIGCRVPAPMDLDALALSIDSASLGASLVVAARLRNEAAYAQRFPAVLARFTDANDLLVSETRLAPRDYLPSRPARRLAPGDSAALELRFPAPDDSATRYALVLE